MNNSSNHIDFICHNDNDLLIKVLTQYLNRIPNENDFKNCQRVMREGSPELWVLCYQNKPLGRIISKFEQKDKSYYYTTTFEPLTIKEIESGIVNF